MSTTETFQLSVEAAEFYESRFVPAIFAEWAPLLVDAARIRPGQSVLDVACGTGVVARTTADRLAGNGTIIGLDLNEGMLAVAERLRPDLDWQVGDVADLPFPDRTFDAVLCQMALMFFPDRLGAVQEMARVTRPGGVVALVVPASLDAQPAYARFVDLAVRVAGPDAASLLGTYWACGDLDELRGLLESAGLEVIDARTYLGTARFGSPEELAVTEVEGSPLVERITEEEYRRIRAGAGDALAPWTAADGTLDAPLRGHVVAARTRAK
jgi:ubiquinone/menaquinone biosynthesis C-methylase UbiE